MGLRGPHQTKGKELQKRGNKSLPTSSAHASDISREGEQPRCHGQPRLQRRCSAPWALGAQEDAASPARAGPVLPQHESPPRRYLPCSVTT